MCSKVATKHQVCVAGAGFVPPHGVCVCVPPSLPGEPSLRCLSSPTLSRNNKVGGFGGHICLPSDPFLHQGCVALDKLLVLSCVK